MPVATFYHIPIGIKVIKKRGKCQFAVELPAVLQRKRLVEEDRPLGEVLSKRKLPAGPSREKRGRATTPRQVSAGVSRPEAGWHRRHPWLQQINGLRDLHGYQATRFH